MIRFYILILALGIGAMQYQLWAGPSSWFRYAEPKASLAEQRAENIRLRAPNEALAAELYSLSNNQDAIESRARHDLNMVRPGELLFRIETPEDARKGALAIEPMPEITADVKPGSEPTFEPKKSDLYHAPKHLRAPKARDRRE